MLNTKTHLAAVVATTFAFTAPAYAVTVTNTADKEHEITFDRGAEEDKQKVAAGASVKGKCPEGCGVRVAGSGFDTMAKTGDTLFLLEDLTLAREKPSS